MHFHLPKPLHGWREFVGEVGVIVLGVLIALTFEQVTEMIKWHRRAADARAALREEVGHGFLVSEERQAVARCVDAQLQRAEAAILADGPAMVALPVHSDVFRFTVRAPIRSWTESAWQGVIAEGLTPHLNDREREFLPIYYAQMQHVRALGDQEETVLGNLAALSLPLRLDPDVEATFLREIESERLRNEEMAGTTEQMMHSVERVGYVPSQADRRDWLKESGTVKFCRETMKASVP